MLQVLPNFGAQGSGGSVDLQGSSPNLQSTYNPQMTANPQIVATFNQQQPASIGAPTTGSDPASDSYLEAIKNAIASAQSGSAPVYAPKYDIATANAQARANAESNVNPYYSKLLNDFVSQQAQDKANTEAQTNTNIQNLQDSLEQTRQANEVTGQRATADTATKEANINQAADWRQVDQGGQYNIDRVAQAVQQARSGLTGSGLAVGATDASRTKFTTNEARQAAQDQQAKDQAELAKARTFEDIATSNKNAETGTTKGISQQKFDLSKFIQAQANDLSNRKDQLEQARLQQVAAEQKNQAAISFARYLQGITNPAQYQAAVNTYGGLI